MPVVKAQHTSQLHQSAIVMDLADLERQAASIVTAAKAEADRLLAQARASAEVEASAIKEQSRQAGRAEGYQAGLAEGQQKGHDEAVAQASAGLTQLIERWDQTLTRLEENLPAHLADAKADLVRLAVAIASRVTHQEALQNQGTVTANVEAAMSLVSAGRTVAVHVHPDEVAVLEGYVPRLLERMRQVSGVEVKPDDSLTPGDCVLRFGAGEIDARLETQIQRIADELLAREA